MAGHGSPNITKLSRGTRWKPGQSGNPTGRRPGLSLTKLVRDELEKPTVPGSAITKGQVLAEKVVNLAQAGNPEMVRLVWRYIDGEPREQQQLSLRELAERLAAQMGVDPDELLAEYDRVTRGT